MKLSFRFIPAAGIATVVMLGAGGCCTSSLNSAKEDDGASVDTPPKLSATAELLPWTFLDPRTESGLIPKLEDSIPAELKPAVKQRLTDLRLLPGPSAQFVVESLLVATAASILTDKVIPGLADTGAKFLQSLWPERVDLYERSATGLAKSASFWVLCDNQKIAPRYPLVRVTIVDKKNPVDKYGSVLFAFKFDELNRRLITVVPLYWQREKKSFPQEGPGAGTLLGEINFSLRSYQITSTGKVEIVPVAECNLLEKIVLDNSLAKIKGQPKIVEGFVLYEDKLASDWQGTPLVLTELSAVPDHEIIEQEKLPAGTKLISSPFSVQIQYTERTPGFLKSSQAHDWYQDFVGRLKGQVSDAAKKDVTDWQKKNS